MAQRKGTPKRRTTTRATRPQRPQSGFQLPPDVSFSKEQLSYGWAYVFRHKTLGYLGRIVLQGRSDGQTHAISEVAGDPDDPMTAKRAAIFTPLSTALTRQLDIATGGTGQGREAAPPPPRPPEPQQVVESKHIQCERCDAIVAFLIFADDATDPGGLEDVARLMHAQVKAFNVPTWVIVPPTGSEPLPERPADILQIWPQREPVQRLRPDEFNPLLAPLIQRHCG